MAFPPPTQRQAQLIWFTLSALAVGMLVGLTGLLIWGLSIALNVLSPVIWPLAVAGVLAYLLDPVVDFLERRRIPRTRAILVVFALAFALLLGVLGNVVPQVVTETRQLVLRIPEYTQRLKSSTEQWIANPPVPVQRWLRRHQTEGATNEFTTAPAPAAAPAAPLPAATNAPGAAAQSIPANPSPAAGPANGAAPLPSWLEQFLAEANLQSAADWLGRMLPKLGTWLFGQVTKVASWFGVFAGLALIPVYLFYFLVEKRGIQSRWTNYLPVADSRFKQELVFVLSSINDYLIAFFRGQVLVAICDGVLYTIGFTIIGLPYAVLIGVVATFLTIIPFLGAIVTCGSALILAVVQFGDFKHPLLVLAVFAVVQNLEGFVIQPKIVGERVGLHPVTIIIALMVGTTLLGGLLGGLLAIPLTAALRVLMFRYIWRPKAAAGSAESGGAASSA